MKGIIFTVLLYTLSLYLALVSSQHPYYESTYPDYSTLLYPTTLRGFSITTRPEPEPAPEQLPAPLPAYYYPVSQNYGTQKPTAAKAESLNYRKTEVQDYPERIYRPKPEPVDDYYEEYKSPKMNPIPIIDLYHHINGVEENTVYYETGNGIRSSESTMTRPYYGKSYAPGAEDEGPSSLVKTGQVSWTSPEGQKVYMSYIADDQGYRVIGSHIPGQEDYSKSDSIYPSRSQYSPPTSVQDAYFHYHPETYETLSYSNEVPQPYKHHTKVIYDTPVPKYLPELYGRHSKYDEYML